MVVGPEVTVDVPLLDFGLVKLGTRLTRTITFRNFAEVIKKYPKSTRAPDAMLKLAQSFISLGQKSDGCTTLGLIKTKYPDAASQTLNQAAALRKTACSKER